MGTILKDKHNRKEILEGHVKDFLNRSNLKYTPLFEGAPTFVTYYSLDNIKSTVDQNLEGVIENLGSESPLKFEKIENFVIYGLDASSLGSELSEYGMDQTYESEATIIPNTIVPKPGDFFSIGYDERNYIFEVMEVTPDKLHNHKFFKISFLLRPEDVLNLEKQVSGNFDTVYESLGTSNRVILEKSSSLIYQYSLKLLRTLQEKYIKLFYKEKLELICSKISGIESDSYLNCSLVNKFIRDNELLKLKSPYFESIFIMDNLKLDVDFSFLDEYSKSIYNAVMEMDHEDLKTATYIKSHTTDERFSAFDFYEKVYDTILLQDGLIDSDNLFDKIELSSEFSDKIINNELYQDSKEYFYENIIIRFINKELIFNITLLEDIEKYGINTFPYSNNGLLYNSLKSYLYIPVILYIIKLYQKNLLESHVNKKFIHYSKSNISLKEIEIEDKDIVGGKKKNETEIKIKDIYLRNSECIFINDKRLYSFKNHYFIKDNGNIVINIPYHEIDGKIKITYYFKE